MPNRFFFLLPIDFDESKFVIDNKEGTFSIVCNIIMSDIVRARDFKEYFNRQQNYKQNKGKIIKEKQFSYQHQQL